MAEKSMGTTLTKLMSGSEIADTVFTGLTSLGEVGVTREEIDTTTHDSPDEFAENMPGKKDAGEVPFAFIIKSDAQLAMLQELVDSGAIESWEQASPSGAKWAFSGWVKEAKEGEATIDGVRTGNFVVRITGKPVFTSAPVSA